MTITLDGILLIAEFTILRLGIPVLIVALLCKALPHLCNFGSEDSHTRDAIETTGGNQK